MVEEHRFILPLAAGDHMLAVTYRITAVTVSGGAYVQVEPVLVAINAADQACRSGPQQDTLVWSAAERQFLQEGDPGPR